MFGDVPWKEYKNSLDKIISRYHLLHYSNSFHQNINHGQGFLQNTFLPTAVVLMAKYCLTQSRGMKTTFTKRTHHGNQVQHLLKFKIQQMKKDLGSNL